MRGRSISLSRARRIVSDHCYFARKTPTGVLWRIVNVAPLVGARAKAAQKIPWLALFLKAYGLVAQERPPLRRVYLKLPWPRLYEYPMSVASVVVEREHEGEDVLFFAQVKNPAETDLRAIAETVTRVKTAPIPSIRRFRFILWFALLPLPLRRLFWWLGMNMGSHRVKFFGSFGVSVFGLEGTQVYVPVSPWTTFFSYGPIAENGDIKVVIGFDHRVMDGAIISKVFDDLQAKLNGPVADELRALAPAQAAQ